MKELIFQIAVGAAALSLVRRLARSISRKFLAGKRLEAPRMPKIDMLRFQPRYFGELRQRNREMSTRINELKALPRTPENSAEFRRLLRDRLENTREALYCAKMNLIQVTSVSKARAAKKFLAEVEAMQRQLEAHLAGAPLNYEVFKEMWHLVSFETWQTLTKDIDAGKLWYARQHTALEVYRPHIAPDEERFLSDLAREIEVGISRKLAHQF